MSHTLITTDQGLNKVCLGAFNTRLPAFPAARQSTAQNYRTTAVAYVQQGQPINPQWAIH